MIPSSGILNQFRNSFEKEVYLLLRLLEFNGMKYQGQFADRCTDRVAKCFFENNPDILVTNGIECLVECKSVGEWKKVDASGKMVYKEISTYQGLLPDVGCQSVFLIYEGQLDHKSRSYVQDMLQRCISIVFLTKNYLIEATHQRALRERIVCVMKGPTSFDASQRILAG
jgi:hypothetical protein